MNIGYEELGRPDQPGDYLYEGKTFCVGAKHIEAWRVDPTILFNVTELGAINKPRCYILGGRVS